MQEEPSRWYAGFSRSIASAALILVIVGILAAACLRAPNVGRDQIPGTGLTNPGYIVSQVDIGEDSTTNRHGQALWWGVTLQVFDDERGSLKAKWSRPEQVKTLKALVVDVVMELDLSSQRPTPKQAFEDEIRRRADELMGQGTVDRVLVTKWVATQVR